MAQPMRKDGEAKVAPDGGPAACGFGNRAVRLALGLWSAVVFAVFLTACSINLAPAHDPSLVQGLSDANNDAMILFADVSTGVDEATFGERRETYNSIIGRIDALRLQASARPLPSPAVSRTLRERLGDENAEMILTPPTESSLAGSCGNPDEDAGHGQGARSDADAGPGIQEQLRDLHGSGADLREGASALTLPR